MEFLIVFIIFGFVASLIIFFVFIFPLFFRHLNYYPSKEISVEITNKRIDGINEALDYFIITYGVSPLLEHIKFIDDWKNKILNKNRLKPKKLVRIKKRWEKNAYKAFHFCFFRIKTRYRQVNYERYGYKVHINDIVFYARDDIVQQRINFLEKHDYYVTFDQFNRIDQRKALTPKLREAIKQRDNYTCQICGKYMPDEVGLHIDHIIPISKGGKSIPSNLRVLCSKCNGRKSDK